MSLTRRALLQRAGSLAALTALAPVLRHLPAAQSSIEESAVLGVGAQETGVALGASAINDMLRQHYYPAVTSQLNSPSILYIYGTSATKATWMPKPSSEGRDS